MDLGISGKVALVTAASKGLGRGSAEALSAEGCRVAICARTQAEVERTAREIAVRTGHPDADALRVQPPGHRPRGARREWRLPADRVARLRSFRP